MAELNTQNKNKIIIKNLQNKIPLHLNRIKNIIQKITRLEGIKYSVSIIFVDDRFIKKLNKQFLKENHPTDVLSFPVKSCNLLLGEIIISVETAEKNSRIFKTTFETELYLYIIHGILHLLGYDDLTNKKRKIMERKQANLLKLIC
ncbi:MAG: rRNA maturation RNase YbeY [Candidatus Omnitrophota bacterium]